jgi:NAD-dependent dihydropyrimidine dehydrogenase PreA subunit
VCGCVSAEVPPLLPELNAYGVHPAHYTGENCSGCGICFYVCPEPGAITVYRSAVSDSLFPLAFAFDDGDIAIDGEIRNSFDLAAGQRPLDFQPIQFLALA